MDDSEIMQLAKLEASHWWYAERRAMLARELPGPGAARLALDIGAGVGGNTEVLVREGWRAVGVEYAALGAAAMSSRGLTTVRADACSLPFPSRAASLIVAYDVLEHITDDLRVARELFRVLRPHGHVLVSVPSDMRLWSQHDVAVGHVRRYSQDRLLWVMRRAGFSIDHVRNWNVMLRPVVSLRRKRSTGSDLKEMSTFANSALRAVIRAERYLPLGRLPGVSLILRAHHPG
ncbi:class I SAM-dependent methyltransferase [Streptomyces sp. NBC_00289]|uniref:class I SAM-dependent methyltransferase n=1 Tax=Streptomyces sp. NBC_00289 TaxID=2975703 RepID=UPI0032549A0F